MAAPESLLLTDLYQLNMMQGYEDGGFTGTAVFEFFVRRLPPRRGFLVAAGLAQVVDFLENLHFLPDDIAYLRQLGSFKPQFLDRLAEFRFSGGVDAMPEGSVFFADEPFIRVIAPLPEAQLVETRIINLAHFQTVVASKAARMVLAAPAKQLVDFGLRRAHGAEAGLLAARASYLAGFAGTATILAGVRFDIPVFGTMAHSFIQAHDSEEAAFIDFARSCPNGPVLLIDTYDTERGAEKVVRAAAQLAREGIRVRGVRLDSGDLADHAIKVRQILDQGGLQDAMIFASGGLDEDQLLDMEAGKAPIDGYGIGTSLSTSSDAPALDCAYKLKEYCGVPRRKLSEGKASWPGRKQVWRRHGPDGTMIGDTLSIEGDSQAGSPLLHPVMRDGRRIVDLPSLTEARDHAARELARLPASLRQLESSFYPVEIAPALRRLADESDRRIGAGAEPHDSHSH